MRVVIEIQPHEEYVDANDATGLTEEGYDRLHAALRSIGGIIDIRAEDSDG